MKLARLRELVENLQVMGTGSRVREAYGYQPTLVIQGVTREELSEILLLAQSRLVELDSQVPAQNDSHRGS